MQYHFILKQSNQIILIIYFIPIVINYKITSNLFTLFNIINIGAACYLELGEFENALEDSLKCLELCKDFPKGYFRVSNSYFYLDKYQEAIDILNKFEKINEESELVDFKKKIIVKQEELILNEKSNK